MPYIQTRTNVNVSNEAKENIKKRLGEAATIIGKSESWLMTEIVDNCNLYFRGDNSEPIAYVDVKLYGKSNNYNEVTKAITDITNSELGVKPDHVYVSYSEFDNWGWNGNNF